MVRLFFIIPLLTFLSIGPHLSVAQTVLDLPDSLQAPEQVDTTYMKALLTHADKILPVNPTQAQSVFLHAVSLSDSFGFNSAKARGLYGTGLSHSYLGQSSAAIAWFDSAATLYLDLDDSLQYFRSIFMKGANYGNMGHYNQAMEADMLSLDYFRRTDG